MARGRAFTLMEVILVVVIIGLLATLVTINLVGYGLKAKIAAAKAQIASLGNALTAFDMNCGRYPTTSEGLNALVEEPPSLPAGAKWRRELTKKYVPKDPWGQDYVYRCPGTNDEDMYDLFSVGPDGSEGTEDDIGSTPE